MTRTPRSGSPSGSVRPRRRVALTAGFVLVPTAFLAAHGFFVKPAFNVLEVITTGATWTNAKVNASTRGSAGGNATVLYAMDPPRNHTGQLDMVGWRIFAQDEEASTIEPFEMQVVKYAADGISPDESPTGIIRSYRFFLSGAGASGRQAAQYDISAGRPMTLPVANHGIAFKIETDPTWPTDGLSVHAQLNLPGDPLAPRVPAPFANQVWTFERPAGQLTATPLGGRTLDTLLYATIFVVDPVLKTYLESNAYGNGYEELWGPEAMHPSAARKDRLGFLLQGGNDGTFGVGLLLASPILAPTPLRIPWIAGNSPFVYLDFTPPFPIILGSGNPNPTHGQLKFAATPFESYPPFAREFWCQMLLVYPSSGLMRLTDGVGIKGL